MAKRNTNTRNLRPKKKPQKQRAARQVVRFISERGGMSSLPMNAPSAYGATSGQKSTLPAQYGMGRSLTVTNFELVRALTGSNGTFASGGDVCNPGLATSYPWLAGIAKQYTKFRWLSLRYIYVPACATSTAGSVYFMANYDYADAGPSSLAQVAASQTNCSGNAWFGGSVNPQLAFGPLTTKENIYVDVDTKRFPNLYYYVRDTNGGVSPSTGGSLTGTVPGGLTFTPGSMPDPESRPLTIYYGADGVAGTANIGNMFVAYTIEFIDPISPDLQS